MWSKWTQNAKIDGIIARLWRKIQIVTVKAVIIFKKVNFHFWVFSAWTNRFLCILRKVYMVHDSMYSKQILHGYSMMSILLNFARHLVFWSTMEPMPFWIPIEIHDGFNRNLNIIIYYLFVVITLDMGGLQQITQDYKNIL